MERASSPRLSPHHCDPVRASLSIPDAEDFLRRKWDRELQYVLRKYLWAFHDNRIAVCFEYEYVDPSGRGGGRTVSEKSCRVEPPDSVQVVSNTVGQVGFNY